MALITPSGKAGLPEYVDNDLGRKDLVIARFPDHDITHQGSTCREVACDCGKVERGDGVDKSFQRTVLDPVPDPVVRFGLFLVNIGHEGHIKPQKIDKLTCRINLGLMDGFGLGHHGCRIDFGPVRPGNQVGSFQENRGPLFPGQCSPSGTGFKGGVYREIHLFFGGEVVLADLVFVVVGRGDPAGISRADIFPVNPHRDVPTFRLNAPFALN